MCQKYLSGWSLLSGKNVCSGASMEKLAPNNPLHSQQSTLRKTTARSVTGLGEGFEKDCWFVNVTCSAGIIGSSPPAGDNVVNLAV
jgi:hypothetical protein